MKQPIHWLIQLIIVVVISLSIYPKSSYWYELRTATPTKQEYVYEEPINLIIDRSIHRDFSGSWTVNIRKQSPDGEGFASLCSPDDQYIRYRKDAVLPDPKDRTLRWWANMSLECSDHYPLKPGIYFFESCIFIYPDFPILGPLMNRKVCVDSNYFEIVEIVEKT